MAQFWSFRVGIQRRTAILLVCYAHPIKPLEQYWFAPAAKFLTYKTHRGVYIDAELELQDM